MAKDKKSFVLYADLLHTVEKLTDEEAGKLFKHLLNYVNDNNPESDRVTELVFEPIKRQLKRDLKKFEKIREKRSEAGKKGMQSRWANNKNNKSNKSITKITDNVNDNVNDNVINKERVKHWNESIDVNGFQKK
jgi:hypothetical protein